MKNNNKMKKNNLLDWENSYLNKDNFIFYPHEEIIRFISKYIKKRIGLNKFKFIDQNESKPKILDIGCGIGRHVKLCNEFNLDAYGFDLSSEAIKVAKNNFINSDLKDLSNRVVAADIRNLPYKNNFFNYMISHGVLDSMHYDIALEGIIELHKKLHDSGLIYLDLISTNDHTFTNSKQYDLIVKTKHEENTVQSFYDTDRINRLLKDKFEIIELYEIINRNIESNRLLARFHIIAKKII